MKLADSIVGWQYIQLARRKPANNVSGWVVVKLTGNVCRL